MPIDKEQVKKMRTEYKENFTVEEKEQFYLIAEELSSIAQEAVLPIQRRQMNSYNPEKPLQAIKNGKAINEGIRRVADKITNEKYIRGIELHAKLMVLGTANDEAQAAFDSVLERAKEYMSQGKSR